MRDRQNANNLLLTFVLVLGRVLLGIAPGLFLCAFAHNEFQAVQFLPAVVMPQVFLGGLLVPVERLPRALEIVSRAMLLTYALEALNRIMIRGFGIGDGRVRLDLAIVFGGAALFLVAGALTLRRTEAVAGAPIARQRSDPCAVRSAQQSRRTNGW